MTYKTKESRLFLILCSFLIANAILAEFIGVKIFTVEGSLGIEKFDINMFGVPDLSFNMSAGVITWPLIFIMTDIKLFRYTPAAATELAGRAVAIEKTLQKLIESQMETFLGVRLLAAQVACHFLQDLDRALYCLFFVSGITSIVIHPPFLLTVCEGVADPKLNTSLNAF
jgi:hypothetical protein